MAPQAKLAQRRSQLSHLDEILLYFQVADDEVLPLRGVLAHEEREQLVAVVEMIERDRFEPDVLADEILELARGDLAQSLEARDLMARPELHHRGLFLSLGITVDRLLLVPHAEER